MEEPGPILPERDCRHDFLDWSGWRFVAFLPLAGAGVLAWSGLADMIVVLLAVLLAPPLFELLDDDARGIRMAIGNALPDPPPHPVEDDLELLVLSMSWVAGPGIGGCPWPIALPPGRHLSRCADEERIAR